MFILWTCMLDQNRCTKKYSENLKLTIMYVLFLFIKNQVVLLYCRDNYDRMLKQL